MRISDWSSDVCSSDPRVLLPSGAPIDALQGRIDAGWTFSRTNITEKFGYDQFREQLPEGAEPVAVLDEDNNLLLFSTAARPVIEPGDSVIAFYPPEPPRQAAAKRKGADASEQIGRASCRERGCRFG